MQADINELVQAIHDSPALTVMVTAGAGTQALADLLAVAHAGRDTNLEGLAADLEVPLGAARSLLEADGGVGGDVRRWRRTPACRSTASGCPLPRTCSLGG